MTMPSDLNAPANQTPTGMTVGVGPQQRLELAMRRADQNAADHGVPDAPKHPWSYSSAGVANPYGKGVAAFEPNTVLFSAFADAKNDVDSQNANLAVSEAAASTSGSTKTKTSSKAPLYAADGQVSSMVSAAMALAQRRVPYVWGGTTANGVDCSGLIYYAARAAGIQLNGKDWPRLRAVDYGKLGTAVSIADARAGDLVYFDEPGDTDHVGIYIGNGQMIQAPTSGDVVRVSAVGKATSIRRVFSDSAFGQIATPSGTTTTSYNGRAYTPGQTLPGLQQALGSTITRPTGSGRTRVL